MPTWLISDDYENYISDKTSDSDLIIDLWENGIVSPQTARTQFIYSAGEWDAPDCPFCGENDNRHYPIGKDLWRCKKCDNDFSITSHRYLDNTKLPLTHWWRFCWKISKCKRYNSADLAYDLEVTQKTAWGMIKTLKTALKDKGDVFVNSSINITSNWEAMRLLMTPINKTKEPLNNQNNANSINSHSQR